jgi:hypothetical protein
MESDRTMRTAPTGISSAHEPVMIGEGGERIHAEQRHQDEAGRVQAHAEHHQGTEQKVDAGGERTGRSLQAAVPLESRPRAASKQVTA